MEQGQIIVWTIEAVELCEVSGLAERSGELSGGLVAIVPR
jgi:hypothetical protein